MKRLLVIDDEPGVAAVIKRIAESCDFCVELATDAEDFLASVVDTPPSVIAMDLSMPGTDGVELLRRLAASECRAHILIVSGFDSRVLETAGRLGASLGLRMAGTISKPVRLAELRRVLNALK